MISTSTRKKQVAGLVLLALLAALFLSFSQWPSLDSARAELDALDGPQEECFQGVCIEVEGESSFLSKLWDGGLVYLRLVGVAVVLAGAAAAGARAFLFPSARRTLRPNGDPPGEGANLPDLSIAAGLSEAWAERFTAASETRTAGIEGVLAVLKRSAGLNVPVVLMAALIFTPFLGGNGISVGVVAAILVVILLALVLDEGRREEHPHEAVGSSTGSMATWRSALAEGLRDWVQTGLGYMVLVVPALVLAAFVAGAVTPWASPESFSSVLGNHVKGIAIAAGLGTLAGLPLVLIIPVTALLLLLGMGTVPAAVLLFLAGIGGLAVFRGLARSLPRKGLVAVAVAVWAMGVVGGLAVWAVTPTEASVEQGIVVASASSDVDGTEVRREGLRIGPENSNADNTEGAESSPTSVVFRGDPSRFVPFDIAGQDESAESVTPFIDVSQEALSGDFRIWNDRPGAVIFDYDRDGDLDFYITADGRHPNWLYRNRGDGTFIEVAEEAGVTAMGSHSTGAVACDVDNDGYQDLYVGAWGDPKDDLDFRSRSDIQGNQDSLFLNNGDGTFSDITQSAFGSTVNIRSATSIACADVDGDSWVDLYVGNLGAHDFRDFGSANHPGHYNVLYRNNGDLTFTEVAQEAGVRGSQIVMRDATGQPIMFENPVTGEEYEGWDPTLTDDHGNTVGEPTGQTHAVLFFDYDDDGDPDLWVANDGDRIRVYRNDSSPGNPRFTLVSQAMGIDRVGSWMGFAIGDYDGDADLDVFVTNLGYHPLLREPTKGPSGSCEYHMRFSWGTCSHFLLRNDGVRDVPGLGTIGAFRDVAPSTDVEPSPLMPPDSLDASKVHVFHETPTGLAAYDFGFGATFFDFDNDGDQDLYWLGSNMSSGAGPYGGLFPAAGRMMRGDGQGSFEDITVRAKLIDVLGVKYSILDPDHPKFNARARKIAVRFHENGKGVAHGDLNGDGYVDLIGTNSSGEIWEGRIDTINTSRGPMFIWMNGGGDNNWITLRLKGRMVVDGTGSNADGIGARVYIKSTSGSDQQDLVQVQEVRAGSSYLSMDSLDLEFGLRTATVVDEIVVFWPSGRVQELTDVAVNQVLQVVEPAE